MTTRAAIVAEARSWLGTPFMHQGRLKGVAVDCAGLVIGVARELGLPIVDVGGYGRIPQRAQLEAELAAQMDPVALRELGAGDVILLRIEREPQHLAIVSELEPLSAVHAFNQKGLARCVEHALDPRWQRRILGAWRYRGVS